MKLKIRLGSAFLRIGNRKKGGKREMKGVEFPRSFRGYKHRMFEEEYKRCNHNWRCEESIRLAYRGFEQGRWHSAMDELHRCLSHFDDDEVAIFNL